jgi:hypothetical protein
MKWMFVKRGKKSKIWNYFEEIGESKAKCSTCSLELSYKSGQKTSMRRHLEVKHQDLFTQLRDSEASKKSRTEQKTGETQMTHLKIGECSSRPPLATAKMVGYVNINGHGQH